MPEMPYFEVRCAPLPYLECSGFIWCCLPLNCLHLSCFLALTCLLKFVLVFLYYCLVSVVLIFLAFFVIFSLRLVSCALLFFFPWCVLPSFAFSSCLLLYGSVKHSSQSNVCYLYNCDRLPVLPKSTEACTFNSCRQNCILSKDL